MGAAEITWLGHATVLIEMAGLRILTDPVLRHWIGPLVRVVPDPGSVGPVDCVLISHLHADHAHLRSLRSVDCRGPFVAPHPGSEWLTGHGLAACTHLWWSREGPAIDPLAEDQELLDRSRARVLALEPAMIMPGHGAPFPPSELAAEVC